MTRGRQKNKEGEITKRKNHKKREKVSERKKMKKEDAGLDEDNCTCLLVKKKFLFSLSLSAREKSHLFPKESERVREKKDVMIKGLMNRETMLGIKREREREG